MKSTLESLGLPPKLLSLTTGNKTEEVELQLESTELQGRINQVIARVGKAKFTNQDDAQLVPGLYKDFVEKITSKLRQHLHRAAKPAHRAKTLEAEQRAPRLSTPRMSTLEHQ